MESDWNLSALNQTEPDEEDVENMLFSGKDVKEFIKRLKKLFYFTGDDGWERLIDEQIDKLAGEKLV